MWQARRSPRLPQARRPWLTHACRRPRLTQVGHRWLKLTGCHSHVKPPSYGSLQHPGIQFPNHGQECHSMLSRDMDFKTCCAHGNSFKESCLVSLVHGESSGAGNANCLSFHGDGSGCWGILWGPLTSCHVQNGPQHPSLAQGGLPVPVGCLVPVFNPSGLLIPPHLTHGFFVWGGGLGSRAPAVVAGPRDELPNCLSVLEAPSCKPVHVCPPSLPSDTVMARVAPSGRGELCQSCVVSGVSRPLVSIYSYIWIYYISSIYIYSSVSLDILF